MSPSTGKLLSAVAALLVGGTAAWLALRRGEAPALPATTGPTPRKEMPRLVYEPVAIGTAPGPGDRPMVTNLKIADLDQDGLPDVIYSECRTNTVCWIRQSPRGTFTEQILARDLPAPASVWAADVQGTGRLDVLVGCMGQIMPNNDRIGSVVVLENLDNRT